MAPVRVRARSTYSTLSDSSDTPAAETRRRTLSRLIHPRDGLTAETEANRLSHFSQSSKVHAHISHLATTREQNSQRRSTLPWSTGVEGLRPRAHSVGTIPVQTILDPEKDVTNEPDDMHDHVDELDATLNGEHSHDVVEHLDAIDPQISTVATLTHTAHSLLLPPLLTIPPTVSLPESQPRDDVKSVHEDHLDRHIEDVLTRKRKVMRTLSGVWAFIKTPLGFVMAFYGFNIIFWGAGIVFFLGKIINLHNEEQQGYWVELCCQVENGLFTLTSIGLIPWRALDTWRISWIWYYKHKTASLRRKKNIPQLADPDDLPDPMYGSRYVHVLSEEEQCDLHYHQQQFMASQTWYRAHGTETHRAFPISYALAICLLNDWNSIFQIGLCACMWGFNRFERPPATTATLLPAGFLCGIGAAICIWLGGKKTRRTLEVQEKMRFALANTGVGSTLEVPIVVTPPPTQVELVAGPSSIKT